MIRNETSASGSVRVNYLPAGAGGIGTPLVQGASEDVGAGLSIVLLKGVTLAPDQVGAVQLRFVRGKKATPVAGLLILRFIGQSPSPVRASTTVPVSVAGSPAVPGAFDQKAAAISATAWLGPVTRVCHAIFRSSFIRRYVRCRDQGLTSTSTTVTARDIDAPATVLLGSSSGQTTTATLKASGVNRATVSDARIPRPGKYSGSLVLDPNAKDKQTLAVTVESQDALIWPLIVLLLGALVGGVLTRRYEITRGARLLGSSLTDAIAPYLAARAHQDEPRPSHFYLEELLARPGSGESDAAAQQPRPRPFGGPQMPSEIVPRLYWRTFGIDTTEALTNLAADIKQTTDRFARWARLDTAAQALKRELAFLDRVDPPRVDAERLVDLTADEPADDADTAARVAKMSDQARVLEIYQLVARRFDRAKQQEPGWAARHPSVDPARIYAAAAAIDLRTPGQSAQLRLDLVRAERLLMYPDRLPDESRTDHSPEDWRDLENVIGPRRVAVEGEGLGSRLLPHFAAPLVLRFQSPEQVRRAVREWDWVVFWSLSALTALAYLLPLYVGKDYGSLTDYIGAFVVGATVPAAISWAIIPYARAMTVSPTPPTPSTVAAGTTADGASAETPTAPVAA